MQRSYKWIHTLAFWKFDAIPGMGGVTEFHVQYAGVIFYGGTKARLCSAGTNRWQHNCASTLPSRCTVGAGATSQLSLCSAGSNVIQWFCRHPPTLRHCIPATASLFMLRCVIGYVSSTWFDPRLPFWLEGSHLPNLPPARRPALL